MNLPHLRRILIVVCLLIVLPGLLREASADSDYVTIVSFTATPGAGQILVEWETASEINVVSFCIQRSLQEAGDFTRISECVPAKGDISATFYQITDTDVVAGTRYYYRLEVINTGGTAEYYGPIFAVAGAPAGRTWHVATTGSDITGDGSEAQPFATIQHGIDVGRVTATPCWCIPASTRRTSISTARTSPSARCSSPPATRTPSYRP